MDEYFPIVLKLLLLNTFIHPLEVAGAKAAQKGPCALLRYEVLGLVHQAAS